MPIACISAYIVVGPTKTNPCFFRAFDSATDSGETLAPARWSRAPAGCSGPERPDEVLEPASLAQVHRRPRVGDRRPDLQPVAHDPGVVHQPVEVGVVVRRHDVGVEAREDLAERLALVQDGQPREAGLEGLEGEPLEVRRLAVHGHAPLGVVVGAVDLAARTPGTPREAVLADDGTAIDRSSPGIRRGTPGSPSRTARPRPTARAGCRSRGPRRRPAASRRGASGSRS